MSDDWRLTDQADFLTGLTFRWSTWTPTTSSDDHDHCEFCWAEFGAEVTDHVDYDRGWVNTDGTSRWICAECFTDFSERLHLTAVPDV